MMIVAGFIGWFNIGRMSFLPSQPIYA